MFDDRLTRLLRRKTTLHLILTSKRLAATCLYRMKIKYAKPIKLCCVELTGLGYVVIIDMSVKVTAARTPGLAIIQNLINSTVDLLQYQVPSLFKHVSQTLIVK